LPPALSHRLRAWLPGGSTGARLFWFWHLLISVVCLRYLDQAKSPERMRFTRQAAEGLKHHLSDYVEIGLWKAAVFHLIVSALILVTVRWWGRPTVSTIEPQLPKGAISTRWFLGLLAVLLVGAATLRLARMDQSYWGDEGWALSAYVHGNYKPADGKDWQGELVLKPAPWQATLWNDSNGGNHYFFSVLQRLTLDTWRSIKGLPDTAFDEAVSRIPPFTFGLASIALAGLLLRWLGRPRTGLLLALLLTVHPWHIRYSTEARGYALMLCLFIAFLWFLLLAARDGRWRWWAGVSISGFLCVWSWKLAALSVIAANAVVLLYLLLGRRGGQSPNPSWAARSNAVLRLIVANLTGGAFCVAMVMPAVMQSPEVTARFQKMGKPMGITWLENSLSGVLIGVPWKRATAGNPVEAPLVEALAAHPVTASLGIFGVVALMGLGLASLLRRHSLHALLCLALFAASAVGAALFKWRLGVEWIYWYFYPLVLPAAALFAAGLDACWSAVDSNASPWRRLACGAAAALIPAAWVFSISPFLVLSIRHPYESQRESFLHTRGRHEPWGPHGPFTGPSKIITCHLWRHIDLYDPRALLTVRDAASLKAQMRRVDEIGGELYFVVGMVAFAEATTPDLMALLRNETFFDPAEKLWAQEHIHHLEAFHYHKGSASQLPPP
jgi:hypothetical protein